MSANSQIKPKSKISKSEPRTSDSLVSGLTKPGEGDPTSILQEILSYHFLSGEKPLEEIKLSETIDTLLAGTALTPEGETLIDNEPNLLDSTFEKELADIKASKGIAQGTDRVLVQATRLASALNGVEVD